MQTAELLTKFLKECEERSLAPNTRRNYYGYLRHFAEENPELPTDTPTINKFLQKRKETPGHRKHHFKCLQAFYSYLEQTEVIEKSPVPAKGPVGRPRKVKLVSEPGSTELTGRLALPAEKLVRGGGSASTSTSISTAEAFDRFLKAKEREGLTPISLENYRVVGRRLTRTFPELPLSADPLDDFLLSIKGQPETRHFYYRALKTLYNFLSEKLGIPNVMQAIKVRPPKQKIRKVLSAEELHRFLSLPFTPRDEAIVQLLLDTEIRAEELCTLTRERVYPDSISVLGKTGERNVPISPSTYSMLIQLAPSGPLFRTSKGPMNRRYLRNLIRGKLQEIGATGVKMGPHLLRHSGAVQYLLFGGDLESLRQKLGHTKLSTTQIYATMSFGDVKMVHQRVNLLGKLTGNPSLERARCYGCGEEIVLELAKVKETKCPGCGQVGKWYLPNHRTQGEEVE